MIQMLIGGAPASGVTLNGKKRLGATAVLRLLQRLAGKNRGWCAPLLINPLSRHPHFGGDGAHGDVLPRAPSRSEPRAQNLASLWY